MPGNVQIANSSYLDLTAYRATTQSSVEAAYDLDPSKVSLATAGNFNPFTVALVLDRNQDPTSLLASGWADRQQALGTLNDAGTLWSTYGANQADFNTVVADLHSQNLTVVDSSNAAQYGNYVTSADSRTVWVAIDTPAAFQTLFGTPLYTYSNPGGANDGMTFWNGDLSVPADWNVDGLWIDRILEPPTADQPAGVPATLNQGPQSPGNDSSTPAAVAPNDLAAAYNFPLAGQSVQTGKIGLVESGIGGALPADQTASFQDLLTQYLQSVGVTGTGTVYVQGADGQRYNDASGYERSGDVGVAAAINPNSTIGLYTGSGVNGDSEPNPFSEFVALQDAIWDTGQNPAVISSSFIDDQFTAPDSPFRRALDELLVDAALRNQSVFQAAGDFGSGETVGNGLPNVYTNATSQYAVLVGGTSISSFRSAGNDPSLDSAIVAPALAGDPATLWQLVAGGLKVLPQTTSTLLRFVETVWNDYVVTGTSIGGVRGHAGSGYLVSPSGPGGVDPSQPVPGYQADYGLTPTTSDPSAQIGRGDPDVSALAGGNTGYTVPGNDMVGTVTVGGTSMAAPLWASLAVQVNTVFADQGLPQLGYMNDLLYTAAVIAPASFNDVTIGSNTSSFTYGGPYQTLGPDGSTIDITPTGFGYSAGPGYDLASGLGTPNGLLLARALTTIGHAETSYADVPGVIESSTGGAWTSGANQSLVVQTTSGSNIDVALGVGSSSVSYASGDAGTYAWTSTFAEQSLQSDFDPNLARAFDGQSQGGAIQTNVAAGDSVSVTVDGTNAAATQANLSTAFGFADFNAGDGTVRVARSVTIAETAGGADDQVAIVRMRQNGFGALSLEFYRVDDLDGTIDGIAPGQTGYAAAAAGRAYNTEAGGPAIAGPGYGSYGEADLVGVNSGDLVAMTLTNQWQGTTYWAFAQANESTNGGPVDHLWNYGANTWGWEDMVGGGDRDFNDLVVGIDFTSASGHQLLA